MSGYESLIASFVDQLQRFCEACDAQEESGAWDVEELGSMNAYFQADLTGLALLLMSADGLFERTEADVFNTLFNADLTPRDLAETYQELAPVIEDYCDVEAAEGIGLLRQLGGGLEERYRHLVALLCRIISAADGVAEGAEVELIGRLLDALER